ncbi:YgcG family protein [Arcicella rosea]|uniref:TPM domain-containing protein n=1 Tax=Arcicella rosea TaxID=502909 RepID=UPI00161A2E34|nr:TPM domain-containing protein [Arcicella rosea]
MFKKFSIYVIGLLFSFSLLSFQFTLNAQAIPEKPNPQRLVNDYVSILSSSERESLEQKLRGYADSTSTQLTIVIVKNTGESDPYDFAMKIAKDWGVGQKDKNNGLVLLWATETRKIRIVTGRGMEATITDAIAKRIINKTLSPNFKAGLWYQGLDEATTEMMKRASGEFKADEKDDGGGGLGFFFIIFILVAIVLFIISKINKRGGRGGGGGFNSGGWGGPIIFTGGGFGGGHSGGGSSGGGGFDFGGFGGGDFGGGGAGGDY